MKPLDFVKTPQGSIALVTETNDNGKQASIDFIWRAVRNEHNAWWTEEELEVINSLPLVLAKATKHPFGSGDDDVEMFFGNNQGGANG